MGEIVKMLSLTTEPVQLTVLVGSMIPESGKKYPMRVP